ncbi:MAG: hypothetical protein RLZZ584_3747 [Pseudomonadota bacterium]|jgi:hypothetical protein
MPVTGVQPASGSSGLSLKQLAALTTPLALKLAVPASTWYAGASPVPAFIHDSEFQVAARSAWQRACAGRAMTKRKAPGAPTLMRPTSTPDCATTSSSSPLAPR